MVENIDSPKHKENAQDQIFEEPPENPDLFNTIIAHLKVKNIDFKQLSHKPCLTSQESADVRGVSLDTGAKCSPYEYFLCVMSASKRLSWKKIRQLRKSKKIDCASKQEAYDVTSCLSGAIPPFGSFWKIQTYLDQSLLNEKEINFNCGLRTESVSMSLEEFLKVQEFVQSEFTE